MVIRHVRWGWFGLLLLGVMPLAAQRANRPRAALVRDIEQVFMNQVSREMGLTAAQEAPFRRVELTWAQKRAVLETEERRLRGSLDLQLTPGVAANPDSVTYTVDALNANRVAYAETFTGEMRDLTPILTPVQRGQFQMARDRLLQKIQQLQQQRSGGGLRQQVLPQP
jgi:hypothetical protein